MLGSSSRLPVHPVTAPPDHGSDWEEATFTRPMRSPFAVERPPPDVDVNLEEAALFEAPRPRAMPRARASALPPPRTDEETTTRHTVEPEFLRMLSEMRDSTRLMQAAIDLGKTVEEPFVGEVMLETSAIRSVR